MISDKLIQAVEELRTATHMSQLRRISLDRAREDLTTAQAAFDKAKLAEASAVAKLVELARE